MHKLLPVARYFRYRNIYCLGYHSNYIGYRSNNHRTSQNCSLSAKFIISGNPVLKLSYEKIAVRENKKGLKSKQVQSDPDLVPPDLVTPRFSDRINFPRYRKLTVFDPDLVPTPI
eukprot:sb/3476695/